MLHLAHVGKMCWGEVGLAHLAHVEMPWSEEGLAHLAHVKKFTAGSSVSADDWRTWLTWNAGDVPQLSATSDEAAQDQRRLRCQSCLR